MWHELKNPLGGLEGHLRLAKMALKPAAPRGVPSMSSSLAEVRLCLSHTIDVLQQLSVAYGAAESLAPSLAPVDLVALLLQVAAMARPAAAADVALEVTLPAAPLWVLLDAGMLRQVLLNLVLNAVRVTTSGEVRISCEVLSVEERVSLVVRVTDTGPGMPPERLSGLTEGYGHSVGGTGLGLYVVQTLITCMDSHLEAQSPAPQRSEAGGGPGSSLWFKLSLAPAERPPTPETLLAEAAPEIPPSLRLLIADDSRVNRRLLQRGVSLSLGSECELEFEHASTAEEALAMACAEPGFDIILMDEHFDGGLGGGGLMLGTSAIRSIRAHERGAGTAARCGRVLIISCSGLVTGNERTNRQFFLAGADACWGKPTPSVQDGMMRKELTALIGLFFNVPPTMPVSPLSTSDNSSDGHHGVLPLSPSDPMSDLTSSDAEDSSIPDEAGTLVSPEGKQVELLTSRLLRFSDPKVELEFFWQQRLAHHSCTMCGLILLGLLLLGFQALSLSAFAATWAEAALNTNFFSQPAFAFWLASWLLGAASVACHILLPLRALRPVPAMSGSPLMQADVDAALGRVGTYHTAIATLHYLLSASILLGNTWRGIVEGGQLPQPFASGRVRMQDVSSLLILFLLGPSCFSSVLISTRHTASLMAALPAAWILLTASFGHGGNPWRAEPGLLAVFTVLLAAIGGSMYYGQWRCEWLRRVAFLRDKRIRDAILAIDQERRHSLRRVRAIRRKDRSHVREVWRVLRDPLNAICGTIDSLEGGCDASGSPAVGKLAEFDEGLETADANTQHMLAILLGLGYVCKLNAGKLNLVLAPVDLVALLLQVAAMARPAAAADVALEVTLPAAPLWVLLDAGMLRQVLLNLVLNAVRVTTSGEVRISCEVLSVEERVSLVVRVTDTGPGMPPERLSGLTEGYGHSVGGTGLGLYVVQTLITCMDSHLEAQSPAPQRSEAGGGPGSSLWFKLSLAPAERPPTPETLLAEAAPEIPPSLRLLIADDSRVNRRLLQRGVSLSLGSECELEFEHASTAEEALAMACAEPGFDIILMDEHFDGGLGGGLMLGTSAIRSIRAHERGVGAAARRALIISCSGDISGTSLDETAFFVAAGADACWGKPYPKEQDLRDAIARMLPGEQKVRRALVD